MSLPWFCANIKNYQETIEQQCQQLQVPAPTAEAIQTSLQLAQTVCQEIDVKGGLTFAEFMQMALYQPALGYYSAGSHKIGAQGDFVTAPELSSLFAQSLVNTVVEIFESCERSILELGAGSGALLCDVMLQLEKQNCLPEKYYILEVSADLRQRQQQLAQQKIGHLVERVQWISELPKGFNGLIYGNEVVDALPVDLYRKSNPQLQMGSVVYNDAGFNLTWQPTDIPEALVTHFEQWPDGYQTEYSPLAESWLTELLNCLDKGAILLSDYGYSEADYYHPQRNLGTLQCYYRQHKHNNPLFLLGLQDITASVNFTQLAMAADAQHAQLLGYNSQAMFLIANGIEQLAQAADSDTIPSTAEQIKIGQQLRTLLMPDEMGETIKFLGIGKEGKQCKLSLSAFSLSNQLHQL